MCDLLLFAALAAYLVGFMWGHWTAVSQAAERSERDAPVATAWVQFLDGKPLQATTSSDVAAGWKRGRRADIRPAYVLPPAEERSDGNGA